MNAHFHALFTGQKCRLLEDPEKIAALEKNIAQLAKTEAAMDIAKEVYNII